MAALLASGLFAAGAPPQPIKLRGATATSTAAPFSAGRAIDGVITEESRWSSATTTQPVALELDLGGEFTLAGLHVFNGFDPASSLRDLTVQFWRDGAWQEIPSARIVGNRATALRIAFDDTVVVRTTRLRLSITATNDGPSIVKEILVWPATGGTMPPLVAPGTEVAPDSAIPRIYLNQSGFNQGKPKRFTAPTLPDGTPFEVSAASGGAALFTGTITGQIGDFTAFEPADPADAREYVVVAGPHTSVPFRIGMWWLERVTYQNAINFMIDSRHHVGNWRAVCRGSFGWRDDHHFGWELHTLVPQFLSNPSAYARMPRQISYEPPVDPQLWGALAPYREDIPDLVKLIHWGADVIVTQRLTHEHLKAQLAYFLYAWPWLKNHLPEQNYAVVREFAFGVWSEKKCDREYPYDESPEHDLLALKTKVGTTKGCYPPGFSIEPNLLLFEVARRERRSDAGRYFEAAHRQAAWIVANLDWNDPLTTKGQRMSEWITLTALTHFLRDYPDRAPAGLGAKIDAWAQVVVRRSANLWDFRKLDDGDAWTPTGAQRTMWNEPGNVVGLPAALLAAQPFVRDGATRARLAQLPARTSTISSAAIPPAATSPTMRRARSRGSSTAGMVFTKAALASSSRRAL
ncbi:MAG: discoidin domain-containing protein [Verrucomicrobia bacterium]|nr:discoidin domain-containing protein [Verrucomicrobiota bacterium]